MAQELKLTEEETKEAKRIFGTFDKDGNGHIDKKELEEALKQMGEPASKADIQKHLDEVDADKSGTIEFDEYVKIILAVRAGKKKSDQGFAKVNEKQKQLYQLKTEAGSHTFSQEELTAFAEHMNICLKDDPDCKHVIPVDPSTADLVEKVADGIMLAKFINLAVPDTIDVRVINRPKGGKKLTPFQIMENQNLVVSAATSIGVQTTNVGADDLVNGMKHPHIVLGVIWQLVKIQLLNSINLQKHPELFRLLEQGETLEDLLKLPPEQLLLRWFNYHLKNAGSKRRVANFSGDVKDSECYTVLLHQIAPNTCDTAALQEADPVKRAEIVIANAKKLNVPVIVKATDIAKGNHKLNLAFTASIFNTCPGLEPLSEKEKVDMAGMMTDDTGDSREERAFRMWINSLGIPELYINNLFEDCRDGLALLKVEDHVESGCVPWPKVEKKPNNPFKRLSNCNIAVDVGKKLKFSLVNIGGSDLTNGNRKLTLGLIWQLMRLHTIKFLSALSMDGKHVTDQDIIDWANKKAGGARHMQNFQDQSLKDAVFFLELLKGVEPQIINKDLITEGKTPEDQLLNAKYAISVARKLGCTIFLLPEDIVEVKPKMLLTFVAAIMAVALKRDAKK